MDVPAPGPAQHPGTQPLGRVAPTFAVRDVGGAIEVGAGTARAGDAVVLAKLGLVGADRAAGAPVGGVVVVVARGAVHWGGTGGEGWGALPATSLSPRSQHRIRGPSPPPADLHHPCPAPGQADPSAP